MNNSPRKNQHRKVYGAGYYAGLEAAESNTYNDKINKSIKELTKLAEAVYALLPENKQFTDDDVHKNDILAKNAKIPYAVIRNGVIELFGKGLVTEITKNKYTKVTKRDVHMRKRHDLKATAPKGDELIGSIDKANANAKMVEKNRQKIVNDPANSLSFIVGKFKEEMNELISRRTNDLELAAYTLEEGIKDKLASAKGDLDKVKLLKELLKD